MSEYSQELRAANKSIELSIVCVGGGGGEEEEEMQVTERDIAILKWVNSFGYVTVLHLCKKFGMSKKAAYGRLRQLNKADLLRHQKYYLYKHGAYYVTVLGTEIAQDTLSPIRHITFANYDHQLSVVSVSLNLVSRFGGQYIPERVLRHQQGFQGTKKRAHLCDGELLIDGKRIAIEVELTTKSKSRLDKIFKRYLTNLDYHEVWYICGSKQVRRAIAPYQAKAKFIKVFDLEELCNEQASA